ncbi:MAG TPA: methylmalonyl-CoA epimerase [Chloroflexota bacterium]|nr:methylmalonyl-CoA epimerase [Chloroflexota bacterium]
MTIPDATLFDESDVIGALTLDHVGIAVYHTEDALRLYRETLGLVAEPPEIVPSDNVMVTFLHGANARIELLEPLPGDSAVARFLEKRGEGMHHLCFAVDDIETTLLTFADAGYALIDTHARPGQHGELLAFVHPKSTFGVLIELYQIAAG